MKSEALFRFILVYPSFKEKPVFPSGGALMLMLLMLGSEVISVFRV